MEGKITVFWTSGSTGVPKAIERSLAQMSADALNIARAFGPTLKRAGLFVASVRNEHFYGRLWRDLVPAALNLRCRDGSVGNVEALAAAVRKEPAVFVTTPSFLCRAVAHPGFAALRGRLVDIVSSGGPLRKDVSRAVAEATGISPLEIYGSTEAGTVAWRRRSAGDNFRLMIGVDAARDSRRRIVVRSPFAMENPITIPDTVKFVSEREFSLEGRADRMVKILERLVSLTAVERALENHPFVAAARAEAIDVNGVARIGAIAVPTPECIAFALDKNAWGASASFIRRDLADAVGAFPRRLRFVREMPVNARGKTTAAMVKAVLAENCREPAVLSWQAADGRLVAEVAFPKDCECFKGHFPGHPILPGVAQLFFTRRYARQAFEDFPDAGTYSKLKFRRVIRPCETVKIEVERKAPGKFALALSVGGEPACSGTLEAPAK